MMGHAEYFFEDDNFTYRLQKVLTGTNKIWFYYVEWAMRTELMIICAFDCVYLWLYCLRLDFVCLQVLLPSGSWIRWPLLSRLFISSWISQGFLFELFGSLPFLHSPNQRYASLHEFFIIPNVFSIPNLILFIPFLIWLLFFSCLSLRPMIFHEVPSRFCQIFFAFLTMIYAFVSNLLV